MKLKPGQGDTGEVGVATDSSGEEGGEGELLTNELFLLSETQMCVREREAYHSTTQELHLLLPAFKGPAFLFFTSLPGPAQQRRFNTSLPKHLPFLNTQ